jgi:hypothetical protein
VPAGMVVALAARMRRSVPFVCAAVATVAVPRAAVAQVCHAPEAEPIAAARESQPAGSSGSARVAADDAAATASSRRGAWAQLTAEVAAVDDAHWEGLAVAGGWRSRRLAVRAVIPTYRLVAPGHDHSGLGDVTVDAQAAVVATPAVGAGFGLGVGLPTGAAGAGLGMGHAMIAPGAWLTVRRGRGAVQLAAALGHAIGADDTHRHHAPDVTVNPMSPVEVGGAVRASFAVSAAVVVGAVAAIAVPLADGGDRRGTLGPALAWRRDRWDLRAELTAAVAGDPYDVRATLGVLRWF